MAGGELDKKTVRDASARTIYVLYLVGIVFFIIAVVGVIMAYVYRNDAPDWLRSHFRFQIRTFWIGLLFVAVGVISVKFIIGYFVFLFWVVWMIVRCVNGIKLIDEKETHPNPAGWLF